SILDRIPAASVERIDIIRGSAPGIDMQGQSVVANIILRKNAADQLILIANNTLVEDGTWAPGGQLEYHGSAGDILYEGTIGRTVSNNDDSPGFGYRRLSLPGALPQFDVLHSRGILQLGYNAHGAVTAPLWGGSWDNNLTLQSYDYSSGISYTGGGGSRFDSITRVHKAEFGSHWLGELGAVKLESLLLQRLGEEADFNTSRQASGSAIFAARKHTGESIGRITARYAVSPALNLEAGGEGAYNFLGGRSSFDSNGTAIALPNANISVNEKRAEGFVNASWVPLPGLSLEGGARLEYSQISATGDSSRSRDFLYLKPRLLLAWSPADKTQIRLRAERQVGQLNFSDFVASSNLSTFGVAAGNADLRPDQRWQFEAAAERHFGEKGALIVSLLHEEITDLEDYIPVGGGLDAPGNIPRATSDKISVSGTIPLDFIGIRHGLLTPELYWQFSSLADPVTGITRHISGQHNRNLVFSFTQDLEEWHSSWGFDFLPAGSGWSYYRLAQVSTIKIHAPYLNLNWTWNPSPDLALRIEANNVIPYRFEQRQDIYPGGRNAAALAQIQDDFSRTRPKLFVQLRKTF
ncbi:MAG: TonB-dependent receptor, partial [Acidobacteriales bacterium]|nr:TonB-dependent receptor [Terriglobales bacterium]